MYLEPFDSRKEIKRGTILGVGLMMDIMVTMWGYYAIMRLIGPHVIIELGLDQWIGSLVQYGLGFPIAYLVMHLVPADPLEQHSVDAGQLTTWFFMVSFLLIAGTVAGNGVNELIGILLGHKPMDPLASGLDVNMILWTMLTSCILAPITEELLFRKALLDRVNRLGDRTAILMSGLFFGMVHGNFYQFFYAFFVGMLFAYIYLYTGRIRYSILLHMMVNFIYGVIPTLLYGMKESLLTEILIGAYDAWELAVAVAGLVLLIRGIRRCRLLKGWLDAGRMELARVGFLNPGVLAFYVSCLYQFYLYIR